MAENTCVEVNFPFGLTVSGSAQKPSVSFDPLRQLLIQIGGTLAPFMPAMKIVDLIKSIVDAIAAIPSCITSLSPQKLIAKLEEVQTKLGAMLSILPPAAVPPMLRDTVSVLVLYLTGNRDMLLQLSVSVGLSKDLEDAAVALEVQGDLQAAGELRGIVTQAMADHASAMGQLSAQSCPFNHLTATLKVVADLVHLPAPPVLGDLVPEGADLSSPAAVKSALDDAVGVLNTCIGALLPLQAVLGVASFGGSASASLQVGA